MKSYEDRKCVACGKIFSWCAWLDRKTCSKQCSYENRKRIFSGSNNPKWSGGKYERFCVICGKPHYRDKLALNKTCGKKECRYKLSSLSMKGRYTDENHSQWKGDNVKYRALHQWAEKRIPKPETCPKCGEERRLHLSNTGHTYKRDIRDYEWLCSPCHWKKDHANT
jgi:hypothetical protein